MTKQQKVIFCLIYFPAAIVLVFFGDLLWVRIAVPIIGIVLLMVFADSKRKPN